MGIHEAELFNAIRRRGGLPPISLPPLDKWPLHLKVTTPVDLKAVLEMPTARESTKVFLLNALRYMEPKTFEGLRTSRTIKYTKLSAEDLDKAVSMKKFERCDPEVQHPFRDGFHGVNIFTVNEMKGRRRLITEPHMNSVIRKCELPKVEYPSRLQRRQALHKAKYMLQIDFEAFYDAIPIPVEIRNKFVFRTRGGMYRLTTLPTGARWSVAVGQGITSVIVDIQTPATVITMIDNILIAAKEGQEQEFCEAVRQILDRIQTANLLTSPDRESLRQMQDCDLLSLALSDSVFLGEEYHWTGNVRVVRNSEKTLAKLELALGKTEFSCRSFVSLVSLIMFALHTTRLNPAEAFPLLRAYRGVYRQVQRGRDWDDPVPYIAPQVLDALQNTGKQLLLNPWWQIAPPILVSYDDADYDLICFVDASSSGWGALVKDKNGKTIALQQRWIHDVRPRGSPAGDGTRDIFTARFSAHAEPRAISVMLKHLITKGTIQASRIAVVTDHYPIVLAQRRANGFGGIGRGYALNKLYELTNNLFNKDGIQVTFFFIAGRTNPADTWSRNFGEASDATIHETVSNDCGIPLLRSTSTIL